MNFSPREITELCQNSDFRPIDFLLASFLANKEEENNKKNLVFCLTILTSFRLSQGYIFLDQEEFKEKIKPLQKLLSIKKNIEINTKDIGDFEKKTYNSFAFAPTAKPLIWENKKIYFQKFFQYQKQISNFFQRNNTPTTIKHLVKDELELELDKTQTAACNALLNYPVTIISGGPGTGKTFLIGKFIKILQNQPKKKNENIKIALVSFTGKAVQKIKEQSPINKMESIFTNCYLSKNVFLSISTIHSLLLSQKSYYYNKEKEQYLWDWLLIDETSMVDLALICQLLKKISTGTKVAFIGDSEQLTPIEAGYFFFDICRALKSKPPFYFHLLKNRYRFDKTKEKNPVLQLVDDLFTENQTPQLQQDKIILFQQKKDFYESIRKKAKNHWLALCNTTHAKEALEIYHKFVILCALNISDFGVIAIQNWIVTELENLGKKKKNQPFYHGRPILIQNNTPSLGLYNGDIGICLKDKKDGYKVYFEKGENFLVLNCNELPEHQSAYAISVHKSQGSEFEEVFICLTKDYTEILHRELLYTAITRAKQKASILTTLEVLQQTLQAKYQETTNLKELFLTQKNLKKNE